MNLESTRLELERFRTAVGQKIGLQFEDSKLGFLGEVLQRRLDILGRSSSAYLSRIESALWDGEIAALARELTVGETYFFRNVEQFRVLADVVLPERMRARGPLGVLQMLSAGCASGEEAYSMAIVAKEAIADPFWNVQIRAVDVNPAALEKAANRRYSSWALRETPAEIQRRWFRASEREWTLHELMQDAVKFAPANLASADPDLWKPGVYDVVFCRNVLMYFSPEQMRAAISRIADALAPGGFLFLGHAETLRGVSERFHLRHSHGTFYYELKENSEAAYAEQCQVTSRSFPGQTFPAIDDGAWVDTIRNATERVAKLVPTPALADMIAFAGPMCWDPAPALDLLRKERFIEALSYVRARPAAKASDPDILLLEATLLAHCGQLVAAEDVCLRLLLVDEFNAGSHYVLALCRDQAGFPERAIEHDRVASYLAPAFAMPRLHAGLLAHRAGNRDTARRELGQALDLLKQEDASRLLLFGGGFTREVLMALCESALEEMGAGRE